MVYTIYIYSADYSKISYLFFFFRQHLSLPTLPLFTQATKSGSSCAANRFRF